MFESISERAIELVDPRQAGPQPPYPSKGHPGPGSEQQMLPRADHGEKSYVGHGRLHGLAAVITGADSGIGRAVALAYAREGADVVVSFLPEEEEDAAETVRLITDAGRRAFAAPGNLLESSYCVYLVDAAFREFGRLDVLVNNAAFQRVHEKIEDWSIEELDRTYKTNIYAMFELCRAALPRMRAGGSIINTASVQAYQPSGQLLAYASTKGAIVAFTKALAELAIKQGVRVNAVAPGPVWTPLIPSTMPAEKVKTFGKDTLMGRAAQPGELAPAYVFLASNDATFMTASTMDVTGGEMLP